MMKKTRAAGSGPGPAPGPLPSLENSTKRISSKTKVSTGSRKTNSNIISAPSGPRTGPTSSNTIQGMSPLQSTLGISGNTRSPIQAPEWKANAAPSTLPSVPMLLDDDDDALMSFPPQNVFAANQRQSSQSPGSNHRHKSQKKQQKQQQPQTQQQNNTFSNNFSNHSNNSSIFGGGSQQQQQQQLPLHQQPLQQQMPQQLSQTIGSRDYSQPPINGSNGAGFGGSTSGHNLDQDIGILSSSSSSGSDSESSSDSDSSDSDSDSGEKGANSSMTTNHQRSAMPTVPLQSMPLVGGFGSSNGGELLQNDLQLSESDESEDSD